MNNVTPRRPYRQSVRARAAEETGERILDAFSARLRDGWFDEIRLEDVAAEAGVTVQTVIRRFGGKAGLLEAQGERLNTEVQGRRDVAPGDVPGAIEALLEDYEASGDLVMRSLAQEDRHPAIRRLTDLGRGNHRAWLDGVFAPWLAGLSADEARRRTDALVAATDVYLWKLLRRDMARPLPDYRRLVETLVAAALAAAPGKETS
ncbi:MAG: TetR/AcrR family transcriptional regulator [Phenylobacterium sp.]|jgi:AcrR family transcriptional regulator|nr:TetR/AcrR family transcriptional regulator [Phenylobacterium sp.]